jgi:transposase
MAKTVSYRAVPIERLTSALLVGLLAGAEKLVVAIDVAKTKMMAGFGRQDGGIVKLVRFESPTETRTFVELVIDTGAALGVPVEALMEPSGTYGEGLRALLHSRGVSVFMLSPQRVHGAREVFDGVPSLHDAKSCVVIAQLHRQGASRAYVEMSDHRKRLRALVRRREVLDAPLRGHLGELEGLCGRHWPELLVDMDVWRARTPLEMLAEFGTPAAFVARAAEARRLMRRASGGMSRADDVEHALESAARSVGLPASSEEREVICLVASEALRLRALLKAVDKELEKVGEEHEATRELATVVGRVTAVMLVAHLGPLSDYASAAALEKACGLNLKIKSSGNTSGRPSIAKRGAPIARAYLYLAAMRLVKNDPLVGAWYRLRGGYLADRKLIALVAVMRKLIRALWHVARGAPFDSTKLIDARVIGFASEHESSVSAALEIAAQPPSHEASTLA